MLPTGTPDTVPGMVMGTIGYMAPEQVRGQAADHRSDIFALGTVLYEMRSGDRAFRGDTAIDTMTAILKGDPPDLPVSERRIPPALARIVDRCLEKTPAARFQSTRDLAFALDSLSTHSEATVIPLDAPRPPTRRDRFAWSVAAACMVVAIGTLAAGAMGLFNTPAPLEPSVRFEIPPPGRTQATMFVLSPDGRHLALVANVDGPNQLWVRPLDSLDSRALPGTEGARYPFWSPDGSYLGFFAQGKLRKIALAGGPAQTLGDAADGRGGTWNRDGVIVFSPGPSALLLRVSDTGGTPASVTVISATDGLAGHRFPVFLPDGAHFLYTANDEADVSGIHVGSLLDGDSSVRVLSDYSNAVYMPPTVPAGPGYLVFRREQTLMAQPFDADRIETIGGPFPLADQVPAGGNVGFGAFSASGNRLVYQSGGDNLNRELSWADRAGARPRAVTASGAFGVFRLSPDQKTVAVRLGAGAQSDIWLTDLERDVMSRFTFWPGINQFPVWSPDGTRLIFAFAEIGSGSWALYEKPSRANAREQLLLPAGVNRTPLDWSSDGKWIVFGEQGRDTALDLWLLPLESDGKPVAYLQTPFAETAARFAPAAGGASRWMAYTSTESGQAEVYVQSIPAGGAKYQISTTGGVNPEWRGDGQELFYRSADRKVMAVPITLGTTVQVGTPRELFDAPGLTGFAPSADGQRFLVNLPAGGGTTRPTPITVVLNWTPPVTP